MRRLFWLGVGAAAGASGTVWAERKVRARLDALGPDHLVHAAGERAKSVGRSVVDAVAEGRGAMREREAQLRELLDVGSVEAVSADLRAGGSRAGGAHRTRPMGTGRPGNSPSARRHR